MSEIPTLIAPSLSPLEHRSDPNSPTKPRADSVAAARLRRRLLSSRRAALGGTALSCRVATSSLSAWHAAPYFASALFGLGIGNAVLLPSLIVQREFSSASYGVVSGPSTAVGQAAYSTCRHSWCGPRSDRGRRVVVGISVAIHLAASLLMWSASGSPLEPAAVFAPDVVYQLLD